MSDAKYKQLIWKIQSHIFELILIEQQSKEMMDIRKGNGRDVSDIIVNIALVRKKRLMLEEIIESK